MGSGRYSSKLSYEDWYRFNNSQRVHLNYVEFAPTYFIGLLIAGIYYPVVAAILGFLVLIFRIIYTVGYAAGGPSGRLVGAIVGDLIFGALLALAFASAIQLAMGK
jgi:glutathione S-transferase